MSDQAVETELGRISFERLGSGPDLVILHSLLTDRLAFGPVVPRLAERLRVNLVDLPGFGQSSPVSPHIDAYADAIGSFLAAGGFDPSRTTLLGNGLGSFIGLATAIRHGSLFDRLCLVGCGVRFPEQARETFATMAQRAEDGGMQAVVDVAVERIFPPPYLEAHPEVRQERKRVLMKTDPPAFVSACRALQRVDYRAEAGEVRNETLIVVGSDDGATPPTMARELHASIVNAQLEEMEGVGHAPQLQAPDRFLETVEGFLSRQEER